MIHPLSSHEPSTPPDGISTWKASCRIGQRPIYVQARTWFAAREQAAVLLGAEPGQINLKIVPAEEAKA
jgi:hypothetical protein